jgi:hypothetical protein
MASPQEVLELAIPHPSDATSDSKREAARKCIEALEVNQYYFVLRKVPVLDSDDGECPTCKCQLVHVMPTPAFENAESRLMAQERRIAKMKAVLEQISRDANPDVRALAISALY